jgi:3-isopropylmalate/(R)-2-methylmalate dehydratase small subunit
MESSLQGTIYKFGDNINSDLIIAGRYLIYIDPENLALHAFEMLSEEVRQKIRNSAILVAGRNFGCGSAREQATTAIRGMGIRAVVACSFARTFYRNAINDGLPIMECPALYETVKEGDEIRIDLGEGTIYHADRQYSFPRLPDSVRKILELGGLAAYLKSQMDEQALS